MSAPAWRRRSAACAQSPFCLPAHCATLLLLAFGCEGIAGVESVSFSDATSESEPACDTYCGQVAKGCPDAFAVYDDTETCLKACKQFAANGEALGGNTIACRLQQAKLAAGEKVASEIEAYCTNAGPGGGDQCAVSEDFPSCEGYCTLYMGACKSRRLADEDNNGWGFDTHPECVRKCEALQPSKKYSVAAAKKSGNTLVCRLYFASAAALNPTVDNCNGAGLVPAGLCLGTGDVSCPDYCRAERVACQDEHEVYETLAQCAAVCDKLHPGNRTDNGGQDTVGCRSFHSFKALSDPATHCPHTGPGGDGVCSEAEDPNCKPYCLLAKAACAAQFATEYADDDEECLAACRLLEDAENPSPRYSSADAQRGNTLKCRTLHAARALERPSDAEAACPAVFGGSPCND